MAREACRLGVTKTMRPHLFSLVMLAPRGRMLLLPVRTDEFRVADTKRGGQLVEANDCRVAAALLEAAYVLLAEAGKFRQLLLGQALLLSDPFDVPPDQLAHV